MRRIRNFLWTHGTSLVLVIRPGDLELLPWLLPRSFGRWMRD